jgi:hypothetical protein
MNAVWSPLKFVSTGPSPKYLSSTRHSQVESNRRFGNNISPSSDNGLGNGGGGANGSWIVQGGSGGGASWTGQSSSVEEVVVTAQRQPSVAANQPSLLDDVLNGVGGAVGGIVYGGAKTAENTVLGLFNAVMHPIQTAEAIGNDVGAAYNYVTTTSPGQMISDAEHLVANGVSGYAQSVEQGYKANGIGGAAFAATQPIGAVGATIVGSVVGGEFAQGAGAASSTEVFTTTAQRIAAARSFYEDAGVVNIDSHLSGIDFAKPVEVVRLPQGTEVVQYQIPGEPTGRYFAPIGTAPETIGVDPTGRVPTTYVTANDVSVLRSTAANTSANPNVPLRAQGYGGGIQYFTPSTGVFIPK